MPRQTRIRRRIAAAAALAFTWPAAASAADFWVDPAAGSPTASGSQDDPFSTLADIEDRIGVDVQPGDTVHLMSGYHGEVQLSGISAATPIVIAAEEGHEPHLGRLAIQGSSGLTLRGLWVSPEYAPSYSNADIVSVSDDSSAIVIEGFTIHSVADASGWTDTDWDMLSANGISAGGDDITIRDNVLRNVNFGLSIGATNSLVRGNLVDGFAGDGMRGLGDHTVFEYNTVKNCYAVNDNHDDGFQSWSNGPGGVGSAEVTGVVLRGNVIINYEDPDQPYRCTLQGIGMFDGTFVDWVIENNVIITDHWHGITLLGARGCRVVNNTVLDPNAEEPGPPWISIDAHKDGTPPEDCIVRNNLTTDLANAESGVTEDTNLLIEDATALFVDVAAYDVHLLPDAPAVDQGSPELAPELDADRIPRPQGAGVDLGAYEWHEDDVGPVDTGTGGETGGSDGDGDGDGTGASADGTAGPASGADDGAASGSQSGGAGTDIDAATTTATSGSAAGESGGCGCTTSEPRRAWLVLVPIVVAMSRRRRLPRTPPAVPSGDPGSSRR